MVDFLENDDDGTIHISQARQAKIVSKQRYKAKLAETRVAEAQVFDDNGSMANIPIISKDFIQTAGLVVAVAGLLFAVVQWTIGIQFDALKTQIQSSDTKQQALFEQILTENKAVHQRLDDMYRYVDAKTENKSSKP